MSFDRLLRRDGLGFAYFVVIGPDPAIGQFAMRVTGRVAVNIKGSCVRKHKPICTFNIIKDNLERCELVHMPSCPHRAFAWCSTSNSSATLRYERNPNVLMLFTFADVGEIPSFLDVCCGVLLLEEDDPFSLDYPPFDPYYLDSLMVLRSGGEGGFAGRIQSDLQELFLEFNDIAAACEMIVAGNGTSQDIIDVVEPLYGNWINVSDAAYNLVARTNNIKPPDPLSKQLVELGCHSIDSVNRARSAGIFRDWREQEDIEVFEPWEVVPMGHMTAVLRVDELYYGHVVMLFNETPYTEGVGDFFQAVVGYIKALVDKKSKRVSDGFTPCQHFLEALIAGDKAVTSSYIENQAQILGMPKEGYFRLAAINYSAGNCGDQPLHLINVINRTFLNARSMLHERSIIVLYYGDGFDAKTEKAAFDRLEKFCAQYGCTAFVSGFCKTIAKVRMLFEQVGVAKRYQSSVEASFVSFLPRSRIFRFEDAFPFYCSDYGKKDDALLEFSINNTALDLISEGEHDRDVSDVRLLYCYLMAERRATPVAEMLHMHRNNVIYRANVIEQRYNLDLDRCEVRSALLSCFRVKVMHSARFRKMIEG